MDDRNVRGRVRGGAGRNIRIIQDDEVISIEFGRQRIPTSVRSPLRPFLVVAVQVPKDDWKPGGDEEAGGM